MTTRTNQIDRARPAFTLVELLVTMTILMLLASIVLFGLSGIQAHAKDRRARAQVMRIHQIIGERMASYENRRMRLRLDNSEPRYLAYRFKNYKILATSPTAKLLSTRELMRMELPDRKADVLDAPVVLANIPSVTMGYQRTVANNAAVDGWTPPYQGAECLYMILARTYIGDSNGLQYFTEREIGDIDNDGMLEIHDPWGNPIEFLRWAPGLTSPARDPSGAPRPQLASVSTLQGNDPLIARDPFDTMQIDGGANSAQFVRLTDGELVVAYLPRNENERLFGQSTHQPQPGEFFSSFAMFPLVFSAGPDGEFNIVANGPGQDAMHFNTSESLSPVSGIANDPYAVFESGGNPIRLGQIIEIASRGHLDNITNHFIEAP